MSKDSQSPQYNDDEIDLFELIQTVWNEKLLVLLFTGLFVIVGGAYAFLSVPVYKASIKVADFPSTTSQVLGGLYFNSMSDVSTNDFVQAVTDVGFLRGALEDGVFDGFLEPRATQDETVRAISSSLKVSTLRSAKNESIYPYEITINGESPSALEKVLNELGVRAGVSLAKRLSDDYSELKLAELQTLNSRLSSLEEDLQKRRLDEIYRLEEADKEKLSELQDQLEVKISAYKRNLVNRIRSLEEAYAIALSLNIVEPAVLDKMGREMNPSSQVAVEVVSSTKNDPLYLRGSRLLGAELQQLKSRPDDYVPDPDVAVLMEQIDSLKFNRRVETLKSRVDDLPFSEEGQKLRAKIRGLEGEQFPTDLNLNLMAGDPIADPSPIKPKRLLILALSLVLGGMVGLIAALVRGAARKRSARAS